VKRMLNPQKMGFTINPRKKLTRLFDSEKIPAAKGFTFVSAEIPIQKSGAAKKHSRTPNT